MTKVMSERDVIVSKGIWYMMTLVSLWALAKSISLLWPDGDNCESSKSRFYRDCRECHNILCSDATQVFLLRRSSSLQGVHYRYTEASSVFDLAVGLFCSNLFAFKVQSVHARVCRVCVVIHHLVGHDRDRTHTVIQ
ncbi:hypothetical protein YC2023_038266 [Brassica napus]